MNPVTTVDDDQVPDDADSVAPAGVVGGRPRRTPAVVHTPSPVSRSPAKKPRPGGRTPSPLVPRVPRTSATSDAAAAAAAAASAALAATTNAGERERDVLEWGPFPISSPTPAASGYAGEQHPAYFAHHHPMMFHAGGGVGMQFRPQLQQSMQYFHPQQQQQPLNMDQYYQQQQSMMGLPVGSRVAGSSGMMGASSRSNGLSVPLLKN